MGISICTADYDDVELYKQIVYPIMSGSLVYHHTPVLPFMKPSPWVVLEYARPEGRQDVIGLFRTSQTGNPIFIVEPRWLDFSRSYSVHFENSGQAVEMTGAQLLQHGVPVRLDDNLTSEMLIIDEKGEKDQKGLKENSQK